MSRGGVGSVVLARRQPEILSDGGCSGALDCLASGALEHVALLSGMLLLVIVGLGSLMFLPKARTLCEQERRRTRAERAAFDRFIERVRTMSPTPARTRSPAAGQPLLVEAASQSDADLSAVREAYADTVLALPHVDEAYDETPIEHMREELSEEVAEAIVSGSTLSGPVHQSLLEAAKAARDRRDRFLEMIDGEAESLATAGDRLETMSEDVEEITRPLCADQSFDALRRQREHLTDYETRIENVVNERQSDRVDIRRLAPRTDPPIDVQSFLYESMGPTYPVLAEAANLLSQISVTRRRVEDELIYRG